VVFATLNAKYGLALWPRNVNSAKFGWARMRNLEGKGHKGES